MTMKRKTKTILEELNSLYKDHNKSAIIESRAIHIIDSACLLYTSPSPRDRTRSRMPSSA